VEKYNTVLRATALRRKFASGIPDKEDKNTDKHSEYVIFDAYLR